MTGQGSRKSRDANHGFFCAFPAKQPIPSYAPSKMEGLEAILGGQIFPQTEMIIFFNV